ncbi:hypothetical protein M758_1G089200 [Ceratodon purpureus]|nr:hypothetical protein M758_1G089200 [Ceratodon purpureus]
MLKLQLALLMLPYLISIRHIVNQAIYEIYFFRVTTIFYRLDKSLDSGSACW